MPIEPDLLEVLVCVEAKKPLVYLAASDGEAEGLFCPESRLRYPFDAGGFPVMLASEAARVDEDEVASLMRRAQSNSD